MTHKARSRGLLHGGAVFLALAWAGGAVPSAHAAAAAAATASKSGSNDTQLGEVLVTTRKREERLQDVPIPVSAFNAADITSKAAVNLTGLSDSLPNVELGTVSLFPNAASFAIRGLGAAGIESFQDPVVAVYMDGAYQTRQA